MSERQSVAKGHLLDAFNVAASIVDALRRYRPDGVSIKGGQATLALLFAAARVARLRGTSRDAFVATARLLWDLSVDKSERRGVSS